MINIYIYIICYLIIELLDISYSKRRWKQIYRVIDKNFDNQISFQEFYVFLYPDHELAKTLGYIHYFIKYDLYIYIYYNSILL